MNDHDNEISNESGNRHFENVLQEYVSRRKVLSGGLALAAGAFFASPGVSLANNVSAHPRKKSLINFRPVSVANGTGPWPSISPDYQYQVLIPWGEPIEPGGPTFSYPPNAVDQAEQIGIGHDGMRYFPIHDKHNLESPEGFGSVEENEHDGEHFLRGRRFPSGNRHGMLPVVTSK